MRGRTSALKIELTATNRAILLSWLRSQKTPVGRAKRARAILLLAEGKTFSYMAVSYVVISLWRRSWPSVKPFNPT